ncbi:MAG TPA: hypothetical protein VNO82_21885 [Solirubrobacteraceae bacterium]|nr:hypothetical protein [Solirubrobacteraceae bacterium]
MNRKLAVILSSVVLAGGAGIAVASGGDAATPSPSTEMERRGGPFDLSALAEELGVTEARLQQAMQSARPADGRRPDGSDMAAALAEELGLSADKVREALETAMPSGGPGGGPPPGGGAPTDQS